MKRCGIVKIVLTLPLFIWEITEVILGLKQVLGWRTPRHPLFALTGHFNNPGPFGGFIACVMAVAVGWLMRSRVRPGSFGKLRMTGSVPWMAVTEIVNMLAWVTLGMGMLVLPASMSRAGWLALAVALAIEALRMPQVREWARKHPWMIPMGSVGVLALLAGTFLLKKESALGRLHIWRMEFRAIAVRPWMGAGPGMGPWAYGEAQEAFFRAHLETVSPVVVRVAGCPEYAFNEFLGLGMEYGIPAMFLLVALVVLSVIALHRANSPVAAGLTAWAIFACASYPLSVPQLRILGAGFVLVALVVGLLKVGSWRLGCLPVIAAALLAGWMGFRGAFGEDSKASLRTTREESPRVVYEQGYMLHLTERYEESTKLLEQGSKMSCDPMFEIIMGKNAEALGEDARAEALYEKAHYMVPSRLYPLVRLMRLQIRTGRNQEALQTAQRIAAMPVNERHTGMVRLREETMSTLDSLRFLAK